MLHNEARKLLLKALATTHNAKEVAECFSVHISTVYRLKKQIDETGSVETRTNLRGRKPVLSAEDLNRIDALIQNQPDITLQEIIDTLQLKVSDETVRKAVLKLGYVYKKKSLHASEQERSRCEGETQKLGKEYVWVQLNCTPFVRQYGILSNRWGDLLCQEENRTSDIRRNSRKWL